MRGTRTGRVWVGVCTAALITVALIIFMVQNTHTVQVTFLGLTGSASPALMLLIAAVGGILLTLVLDSAASCSWTHGPHTPLSAGPVAPGYRGRPRPAVGSVRG